ARPTWALVATAAGSGQRPSNHWGMTGLIVTADGRLARVDRRHIPVRLLRERGAVLLIAVTIVAAVFVQWPWRRAGAADSLPLARVVVPSAAAQLPAPAGTPTSTGPAARPAVSGPASAPAIAPAAPMARPVAPGAS